jgi:hypothetical protein
VSFPKPTADEVKAAIPFLSSPEHETYFFDRLENPEWVRPLAEQGAFSTPPPRITTAGGIRFPSWAPSRYLARMATLRPRDVADVVLTLQTDNSRVIWDCLRAIAAMPPAEAARCVPFIGEAAGEALLWLGFEEAAGICASLGVANAHAASLAIAAALFAPRLTTDTPWPRGRDEHSYRDGLSIVVPALAANAPEAFLQMMGVWLQDVIRARSYVNEAKGYDGSEHWRAAIEDHEQNREYEVASMLTTQLRDALTVAVGDSHLSLPQSLSILAGFRFIVFRRLRLYMLAEFGSRNPELLREALLDRSMFDDYRLKHEYARLAGRHLPQLSAKDRSVIFEWIVNGPNLADYIEFSRREHGREPSASELESRRDYWRLSRLHWIRDHLGDAERSLYESLLKNFGVPELADLHSRVTTRWGNESPIKAETFEGRSLSDVLQEINGWTPTKEQRWAGANTEGLTAAFAQYVKGNRSQLSPQAELLQGSRAPFARVFLAQLAEGIKVGEEVDVEAALRLCEWVLTQEISQRTVPNDENEGLIDPDWQWTRDTVAEFVEQVCDSREGDQPRYAVELLRKPLWDLVWTLRTERPSSDLAEDGDAVDPRLRDYLTVAINSPRGKGVEAAMAYARWVTLQVALSDDGHKTKPNAIAMLPELSELVGWHLDGPNRRRESLAILGSRLGLLYWIDPEWLRGIANSLFDLEGLKRNPPATEGWAAWNAFLNWVQPHIEYYRLFQSRFAIACDESATLSLSGREGDARPMHRLAEHLVVLFARGQLSLEDDGGLISRWFQMTSPDLRMHVIEFVGRTLMEKGQLPQDVLERFRTLWEIYWGSASREEVRGNPTRQLFGLWFASGRFPTDWSLKNLVEFSKVVAVPEPDDAVVERLAEIVEGHLTIVLPIVQRMVLGDQEGWRVDGWLEPLQTILRAGLLASGSERSQSIDLISVLARRGYLSFGELLTG